MADQRNESGETLDELFERLDDHDTLEFDDERRYMAVGWTVWEMARSETPQDVLSEYLSFVYSMRGLEPGTPIPLRRGDLEVLESVTGWTTDQIHLYLHDLMLEQYLNKRKRRRRKKS
jgi:hypothetical protein